MLLFIAIVATLNLCLGYVMGVWIGELPSLPSRKPKDPPEPALDLNPEIETDAKPAAKKTAPKKPAPKPEPPAEEEASASKPTPEQVMEGMAAFQAQLAKVGAEMQASVDDEDAFGECAGRLQQANHEYLEQSKTNIEELSSDPNDHDAIVCSELLAENTKQVGEKSEEIDSMLADGVPDEATREKLVDTTSDLEKLVQSGENTIDTKAEGSADAKPEDEPAAEDNNADQADAGELAADGDSTDEDSAGGDDPLAKLDAAQRAIQAALDVGVDELVVATVQRDPLEDAGADDATSLEAKLFEAVTEIVSEYVDDSHVVAPQEDGSLLLALTGDTPQKATERIEQIRQLVEKATFVDGSDKVKATVTCALADAAGGLGREQIIENLHEALGESAQHGANRSYHHDGSFPAPVNPDESIEVESRTITL